MARLTHAVGVRDSKDPENSAFALAVGDARELVARIKRGELDTP